MDHAARRDRLRARLREADLDALWVTHLANVRYLTGFTGTNGQVLVTVDPDRDLFLTDGRYATQSEEEVADLDRWVGRGGGEEEAVRRVAGRLAFEADRLSWRAGEWLRELHPDAEPSSGHVERLRAVKDLDELDLLREACRITDAALATVLDHVRPGATEREVADLLDRAVRDLGADGPSFPTIVASGPNSAVPHHRPTGRRLQPRDLVKVDFGAEVAGYHADMTRTVALGEPDPELRAVHDLVREAQAAGRAAVAAGNPIDAVDAACRQVVEDRGYGEAFLHLSGHGVGLEVHEWPTVGAAGTGSLEAGMTVTVEPGVYLAGRGGVRIEDTVAVTSEGPPEVLTTSSRDLTIL